MKYKGRLKDIEDFRNIVIRSDNGGNVLTLGNVAEVELGSLSYAYETFVDGNPGVNFVINPMAGANTTEVNEKIMKLYDEVRKTMPEGMDIIVFLNTNEFLYASIYSVIETLVIAILLVILVVYFFLQDFRSTLIPSIAIIISVVGTFTIIQIADFSINILTLFALVLAIGTVVDDSIIVVEAVQTKFENGAKSAVEATQKAMQDVTMAVFTCTIVFMAVFVRSEERRVGKEC